MLVVVAAVLVVVSPKGSQGFPEFSESPQRFPKDSQRLPRDSPRASRGFRKGACASGASLRSAPSALGHVKGFQEASKEVSKW